LEYYEHNILKPITYYSLCMWPHFGLQLRPGNKACRVEESNTYHVITTWGMHVWIMN